MQPEEEALASARLKSSAAWLSSTWGLGGTWASPQAQARFVLTKVEAQRGRISQQGDHLHHLQPNN